MSQRLNETEEQRNLRFGLQRERNRALAAGHDLGERLLDMTPAELDEVFDIAISRMVEMGR